MHAQSTFYHQGYDLFDDIEPYMKQVAAQVSRETPRYHNCKARFVLQIKICARMLVVLLFGINNSRGLFYLFTGDIWLYTN